MYITRLLSRVTIQIRRFVTVALASFRYHRRKCQFEQRMPDFAGVPVWMDDDLCAIHTGVRSCPYAMVITSFSGVPVIVHNRAMLTLPGLLQLFVFNHEYAHVQQVQRGQIDLSQKVKGGLALDRVDLEIDADQNFARHFAVDADRLATILMLLFDASIGGVARLTQVYPDEVLAGTTWYKAETVYAAAMQASGYNGSMRQRIAACVEAKHASE